MMKQPYEKFKDTTPEVVALFDYDPRVQYVYRYDSGFVPMKYKWPAPGVRAVWRRDGRTWEEGYDRKRSGGTGPDYSTVNSKFFTIKGFASFEVTELAKKQGHM